MASYRECRISKVRESLITVASQWKWEWMWLKIASLSKDIEFCTQTMSMLSLRSLMELEGLKIQTGVKELRSTLWMCTTNTISKTTSSSSNLGLRKFKRTSPLQIWATQAQMETKMRGCRPLSRRHPQCNNNRRQPLECQMSQGTEVIVKYSYSW